jgi:hypothetical protein
MEEIWFVSIYDQFYDFEIFLPKQLLASTQNMYTLLYTAKTNHYLHWLQTPIILPKIGLIGKIID